ncbi:GGIII-like transmembrane region-containing protein, partial [Metabacillus fastidiosus]
KVRDIGIQVMVEPPTADDPASLPQDRVNDIEQILSTIVRTSIDKTAAEELTDQAIQDKIVVSVQPFGSKEEAQPQETAVIPMWMYIVGGALLLIIIILVILLIRKKRNEEEVEEEEITIGEPIVLDDINEEIETEATVRKKQLEQMAKEKPEDFAKLLRSWISED